MPNPRKTWSDDKIMALRKLVRGGMSISAAARELGEPRGTAIKVAKAHGIVSHMARR